jgi:phosphotransferase system  glucose/maltose/N-acetylglucosamine-specific IIC component
MKRRFVAAFIAGAIGAGVGVAIAFQQDQRANMLGIALATGLIGFFFGLVFKLRLS